MKGDTIYTGRKEEFGISEKEFIQEGFQKTSCLKNDEEQLIQKSKQTSLPLQEIKTDVYQNTSHSNITPEHRKSFQVRAMFRKTLSYQMRQVGTNLCCVGACPTILVLIAFLLGSLLEHYIQTAFTSEKYEYCSNEFNGTYVLPGSSEAMKSGQTDIKYAHYDPNYNPCSIWYGTNDHFPSLPYDMVPEGNEANINRDTVFHPPVSVMGNYPYLLQKLSSFIEAGAGDVGANDIKGDQNDMVMNDPQSNEVKENEGKREVPLQKRQDSSGDIKSMFFNDPAVTYITRNIIRPYGFVAVNKHNDTEKNMIGKREVGPSNITLATINFDQPVLSNHGYLDYTYTRYALNMYNLLYSDTPSITFERLPTFKVVEVENEKDLDEKILKNMRTMNKILTNTTFDKYTEDEKAFIDLASLKDTNDAIRRSVDFMPYGYMYFNDFNEQDLKYDMILSVGENNNLMNMYTCETCGVAPYMNYPSRGKRLLYFLTEFSNSVIRKITDNKVSITQGFRAFPEIQENGMDFNIGSMIGIVLFPWGVSFLLPIFVIGLVKEKEERYLVMMNMNGMKTSTYYFFTYMTNLILSIISMAFFTIVGIICGLKMFTNTPLVLLILELFIWCNVQVVLAFVISFFFKRNGSALMASFLIVLISIVLDLSMVENFEETYSYFLWPPFAFYHILYKFSEQASFPNLPDYRLSDFVPGNRVFNITMIMIFDYVVLCILAFYFKAVIPQEYGSHKPWHLNFFRCFRSKKSSYEGDQYNQKLKENPFYTEQEAQEAQELEDDDVRAERQRVLSNQYDPKSPLVVKNLRKEYPPREKGGKPHVAVHSVTFAVEEGVVFGLLGPNGAGKTTLINSLIGVYSPTSGYARLAGHNIQTEMNQVYKSIGICPQHDILWNDLTVEEHLLFYARLKGIDKNHEEEAVKQSLKSVGLEELKKNRVKGLSGGEKRRLSIAIALVGNPKIIFLDEPTTGLDPDVRRLIWSILNEVSSHRTIMITTHSMEEAEVLCHRIGIMSHGILRCCNTSLRLKELYGTGFKLTYSNRPENYRELKKFITSIIPAEHKVVRDLASSSIYEFIPPQGLISNLFEILEREKDHYGITDWGISQSSLEEVFLSIISENDADAN